MSIYTEENIVTLDNEQYEKLFNHPYDEKYRIIFNDEDYDYIEDERMIAILDEEYYKLV